MTGSIFPDSGLNIPVPRRSVRTNTIVGDVSGTSIVVGDGNVMTVTIKNHALPPPEAVDAKAELAALGEALAGLATPERAKLDRALAEADEEVRKPAPDKADVGLVLARVAKLATAADNFSEHVEKLVPRFAALVSWLGPAAHHLVAVLNAGT